jgi:hypothetical protein
MYVKPNLVSPEVLPFCTYKLVTAVLSLLAAPSEALYEVAERLGIAFC